MKHIILAFCLVLSGTSCNRKIYDESLTSRNIVRDVAGPSSEVKSLESDLEVIAVNSDDKMEKHDEIENLLHESKDDFTLILERLVDYTISPTGRYIYLEYAQKDTTEGYEEAKVFEMQPKLQIGRKMEDWAWIVFIIYDTQVKEVIVQEELNEGPLGNPTFIGGDRYFTFSNTIAFYDLKKGPLNEFSDIYEFAGNNWCSDLYGKPIYLFNPTSKKMAYQKAISRREIDINNRDSYSVGYMNISRIALLDTEMGEEIIFNKELKENETVILKRWIDENNLEVEIFEVYTDEKEWTRVREVEEEIYSIKEEI